MRVCERAIVSHAQQWGGISAPPLPDRTLKEPDIRPVEPIQRPGLHKGTITQRSAPG